MNQVLQRLFELDTQIHQFNEDQEIIHQGLAPLLTNKSSSIQIQKASLFEQSKHSNWGKQAQLLFAELNRQNIKFLVFKGFAFTHLLYQNTWKRPYTDIDLFISKSDYLNTVKILESLEFYQYRSRQGQFISFQNSFFKTDSYKTTIDLHWQINNRIEFHKNFPFERLFNNSITLGFNSTSFQTPSLIHSFIVGCFHYQAHRPEDRKHIWLYDLALLWLKIENKNSCISQAKETNQTQIVSSVLNKLNDVFGSIIDVTQLQIDASKEATASYTQIRKSKFADIKIRFKNIHGFKNKLKFISEYIFQSKEYVQNRYQLSNTNLIYLYYPKMWVEDFIKLFKTSNR